MSDRNPNSPLPIGGKAKALSELAAAGFDVPPFYCSPENLEDAVRDLGFPLVVRSSASVEDGPKVSFAGQFKSFLNLRSIDAVKHAVVECLEAVQNPCVLEYCRRHGLNSEALRMGFIVQRMIEPDLAGVAFTVNPLTGAEEVIIEACLGLADDLLLGRCPPLSPNHELVRRHAPQICELARRVQRHFGAPQDVEFAVKSEQIYIVQARPITQINFAPELGVWTNADFRDGGVSSSVCTPLMWSLYDYIWEDSLKGFLRDIRLFQDDFQAGKMFFGRPYWNLGAVKKCLLRLPGFNERKFDEDLSVVPDYPGDGLCTPVTLRGVMRALPTLLAVPSIWKEQERFDRAFLGGGFQQLVAEFETVSNPLEGSFRRLIEQAYRATESNYFRTIFCASLAKLDFTEAFPDFDYATLVANLPPLEHFKPVDALYEMRQQGSSDLDSFLKRFRHHSRRELDIRAPRWDEDPEWIQTLLANTPVTPRSEAAQTYGAARRDALARLPWFRRRRFLRKLERLRTFLWLREEMRDLSSRLYYLIRRHVLAIAKDRGLGDDIFFMTFQQILDDDRSQINSRRERYESYRNFVPPNELGVRIRPATPADSSLLRGLVASRGMAEGPARVVRTVEAAASVPPGAVLVCPFTDPGWTPVLSRVAGVVTETGGLLSHAAIICREYGIPALLSVPNATNRIPDGHRVRLRPDRDWVEIVDMSHSISQSFPRRDGEWGHPAGATNKPLVRSKTS